MARDYLAALPSDRFPHLAELADDVAADNADERFELFLDLFVDGLAQRALPRPAGRGGAAQDRARPRQTLPGPSSLAQ